VTTKRERDLLYNKQRRGHAPSLLGKSHRHTLREAREAEERELRQAVEEWFDDYEHGDIFGD
jgi:hypothetical protein